jgi:hypothetical protein
MQVPDVRAVIAIGLRGHVVHDVAPTSQKRLKAREGNWRRCGSVTSKIITLLTADDMDQAIRKSTAIDFLPPGH